MIKIEQLVDFGSGAEVGIEDSGRAMIVHPRVIEGEDPNFFLRFQSWDDAAWRERGRTREEIAANGHPTLNSMLGKTFKITIEEIT